MQKVKRDCLGYKFTGVKINDSSNDFAGIQANVSDLCLGISL
jgi:hypothetical protein